MIELQHIWKQFDSRVIFSDLSLNFSKWYGVCIDRR